MLINIINLVNVRCPLNSQSKNNIKMRYDYDLESFNRATNLNMVNTILYDFMNTKL